MDIATENGRIRLQDGALHCESRRTFGSAFMMFGMAVISLGIPVMLISAPLRLGVTGLIVGSAWLALVWYWAGGRFGTFVVDPERRELRTAAGEVLAPLARVRFSTTLDITDRSSPGGARARTPTCVAAGSARRGRRADGRVQCARVCVRARSRSTSHV